MGRSACATILNLANFLVGALIATGGVLRCIQAINSGIDFGFQTFIVGAFLVFFGLMIIFVEIRLPSFITAYAGFLCSFLGRGLWYLFMGCLILGPPVNNGFGLYFFIAGLFVIIVGFIYIILQFIAAVDRPRPIYVQQSPQSV